MKTSTRIALFFTLALVIAPVAAHADVTSDVHLLSDGKIKATNITVMQRSGSNFFVRATWGQAFIRMVVLANASTTITKNHGEKMIASEIKEGDLIDVEGALSTGADSIVINASKIRDISQLRESKTISGTVKSINAGELSFVLPNKSFGDTKVILNASTPITKGLRTIEFSGIAVGDKIVSAVGTYDYGQNTLTVSSIEVYQTASVFTPKNFEGKLKSISGTSLPTSLVATVGGADYTVYLDSRAGVLKNNKSATTLNRFEIGDKIRFYGAIRQANLSEIDAEVVRDLEF